MNDETNNQPPAVVEERLNADVLNKKIIIDDVEYELVPKKDTEELLNQLVKAQQLLEETEKERALMEWGIFQICGTLGLTNAERTAIKQEVINEEESVFKNLMKSGMELFGLFTQTNLPGRLGNSAKEKIKVKFGFIEELLPLLKSKSNK